MDSHVKNYYNELWKSQPSSQGSGDFSRVVEINVSIAYDLQHRHTCNPLLHLQVDWEEINHFIYNVCW